MTADCSRLNSVFETLRERVNLVLRALAVWIAVSGFIEKASCLIGVVREIELVRFERPACRRDETHGRYGEAASRYSTMARRSIAVADRMAHAHILENRIAHVEAEILVVRARKAVQLHPFFLQLIRDIRGDVVDDEVGGLFSQLERSHDVVRHDLEHHAAIARQALKVFRERFQLEPIVDEIPNELIWTGADRMLPKVATGAVGHYPDSDQIDQERTSRFLQHELDGVGIDGRHRRDELKGSSTGEFDFGSRMLR